jgi:hypothetical protein
MRYCDFSEQEQHIIDEFLEKFDELYPDAYYTLTIDDLADDEIFFQTEDQIRTVIEPWFGSPGSYGYLAEELEAYLDDPPEIGAIKKLEWGHVMAVDNSTFLFMSNSWSDSGLFLNA